MSNNSPRKIRIAKILMAENGLTVPRSIYDEVLSQFLSCDDIFLSNKMFSRGCFELRGPMRKIRGIAKKVQRKHQGKFYIDINNNRGKLRMRCLITIRPMLPTIPDKAKAKFTNGVAEFVNGPFKGNEVVWSSRSESQEVPDENDLGEDIFIVEPDRYRDTFYGWKRKY
jgi:hypothetical protein